MYVSTTIDQVPFTILSRCRYNINVFYSLIVGFTIGFQYSPFSSSSDMYCVACHFYSVTMTLQSVVILDTTAKLVIGKHFHVRYFLLK